MDDAYMLTIAASMIILMAAHGQVKQFTRTMNGGKNAQLFVWILWFAGSVSLGVLLVSPLLFPQGLSFLRK